MLSAQRLTRPQLAGRIQVLRDALDLLWCQTERDGAEPFTCVGSAKVELIRLETQLRDNDAAQRGAAVSEAARDIAVAPLAVRLAMVGRFVPRPTPAALSDWVPCPDCNSDPDYVRYCSTCQGTGSAVVGRADHAHRD